MGKMQKASRPSMVHVLILLELFMALGRVDSSFLLSSLGRHDMHSWFYSHLTSFSFLAFFAGSFSFPQPEHQGSVVGVHFFSIILYSLPRDLILSHSNAIYMPRLHFFVPTA